MLEYHLTSKCQKQSGGHPLLCACPCKSTWLRPLFFTPTSIYKDLPKLGFIPIDLTTIWMESAFANRYPVNYLNFQLLEVVSRHRDPQPQVVENYPYLFNLRPDIYKS